jgi:endonuclease-8
MIRQVTTVPEGDTVWLHAKRLHEALAGHELVLSDFRVPKLATTSLVGRTVLEVVPRGKHMLTRMSGGITLHTHLKMDGTWHIIRRNQPWPRPTWQIRLILATAERAAVGMRMPVVELIPTAEEARVIGHLGPDVLAEDFDRDEAARRIAQGPDEEIGNALLDQRNLAGLGNLYRVEALFLQGVTPWTKVADVDVGAVVDEAVTLIRANVGGWTQPTTGSPRPSEEHWVFERSGRQCWRCFTKIRSAEQGRPPQQRLTYWCPQCQRGPAPG